DVGSGASIDGIAAGPDGNLWFTQQGDIPGLVSGTVGLMTPAGVTATFAPPGNSSPGPITAGSDGNMWFVDQGTNSIGRITMSGTITEFPVSTPNAFSGGVPPTGITSGPDGNIWFTEQNAAAAIGKLVIKPVATLSSSSLTFGSQVIGTTSTSQVVT